MDDRLPLMRKILDQITRHRSTHNQSFFRRRTDDGRIEQCIGGWAITLAGQHRWIGNEHGTYGQIQVEELATGRIVFADQAAADLLGLDPDEATFVLMASDDKCARSWIEDQVAAGERRIFDQLTNPLTFDSKGHIE